MVVDSVEKLNRQRLIFILQLLLRNATIEAGFLVAAHIGACAALDKCQSLSCDTVEKINCPPLIYHLTLDP